jgi:hypothetical protein
VPLPLLEVLGILGRMSFGERELLKVKDIELPLILNPLLTINGTSLCNCVTNTRMDRYYKMDDNFVLII